MKISELGEFGLIELLAKLTCENKDSQSQSSRDLLINIGDDAAAWRNDSSINLTTVDCLVQNVHFSLETISWNELGWKALAVSLSDIAAMGGIPKYALFSLGLPEDTEVENVAELYKGLLELGQKFGVTVIGGNISKAPVVFIDSIVFGNAIASDIMLTRSAAVPGDKIAVTGYLGGAAGGLKMLKGNLSFPAKTGASLRQALNKPSPRIAEGQLLVEHGVKSAMDISDGLIADLGHICKASHVGAIINTDAIPVHPAVKSAFGKKALEMALSGGEDYELLFTASAVIIEKVKKYMNCLVTVIGEVVADDNCNIILKDKEGKTFESKKTGWNHFEKRD